MTAPIQIWQPRWRFFADLWRYRVVFAVLAAVAVIALVARGVA